MTTPSRIRTPPGMVALDDDAIVRVDSITAIMRDDESHTTVRLGTATIRVDCTIEELLRRIDVQIPRSL